MTAEFWVTQTFNGLSYGALLFLLASGLSLIFGVMRIVNLAHGSYFMLGGYVGLSTVLAGIASVGWRHEVVVDLVTTLEQARRRLPPTVGTLTEMPDGVRLTARAERLDGMAQLLAGLGCSFTIVAPEALRAEVTALAARLMSDAARLGVNI